jgi:hypothetical protein
MMRWNVVIGGQEISREGLLVAALLLLAPLATLYGLTRFFPPWEDKAA